MSSNEEKVQTTHRFLEQVYGFQVAKEARPGTPAAQLQALDKAWSEGLITADEHEAAVRRTAAKAYADLRHENIPDL